MINKISPLAPKILKSMKPISGVNIYTYCANLYNYNRLDVLLFIFDSELNIAEVFTNSKTRSITIDWNIKNLKKGKIKALLVNSGNANTFTGKVGELALNSLVNFIGRKFKINSNKIFVASTGVIGEPFPFKKIIKQLLLLSALGGFTWVRKYNASSTHSNPYCQYGDIAEQILATIHRQSKEAQSPPCFTSDVSPPC